MSDLQFNVCCSAISLVVLLLASRAKGVRLVILLAMLFDSFALGFVCGGHIVKRLAAEQRAAAAKEESNHANDL